MTRITGLLTAPFALVLVVALGATAPASASTTTERDPEGDVFLASAGGGIDLAAVQLATLSGKRRIGVTFRLHAPVPKASLEAPGGVSVAFARSTQVDRMVTVATVDGVLGGKVCSVSRERSDPYDCLPLPARPVDATTYRVVVARAQVKDGAKVLRWTARSLDLSNDGLPASDQLTAADGRPFRWRL